MIHQFSKFFLKNKALSWLLLCLVLSGGLWSYLKMGKLEDAPFTIKQAVVVTSYPGASPMEVREQVTDILEEAIQSLDELYYLKTDNRRRTFQNYGLCQERDPCQGYAAAMG